jgi:hypothetical protein
MKKKNINNHNITAHSRRHPDRNMKVDAFSMALLAASVALPITGFTAAGIAKGSLAAGAHSAIGNVAAGSAFAYLMSLGAKGMALKAGVASGALLALRSKI